MLIDLYIHEKFAIRCCMCSICFCSVFAQCSVYMLAICNYLASVRRNPATCRAVDNDIEKEIKNWLRFAKDREGGRSRREARKLARMNVSATTRNHEESDDNQ